jgi:hypothetical protein
MNLERTDQELSHWRERLKLASENLHGFAELPACQWAASGFATGRTAARLAPTLGVMNDLHSYLDLLTGTIDRAAELRGTVPGLRQSSKTLAEIDGLLEGASINLVSGPTPPGQRELLRPIQTMQAISPRELLEAMLESFRLVRDVVLEVDASRTQVSGDVARLEQQVAELQAAGGLGDRPAPFDKLRTAADLAEAASQISSVKALADSDPLEAVSQAQAVGTFLESARQRIGAAAARQTTTRAGLAEARTMLERLVQVHERARQADAERVLKVEEERLPAMSDDTAVDSIAAWLGRLEQTALEGKWGPAGIGLDRWRQEAERRLAAEEAVIRMAESALNRRRDLRGLIDALAAKAQLLGRAGDPELSGLAAQAFELLGRRPTPMQRAREVVKEYERRLL